MALLHRKGMDDEDEIEHENKIGKGRKLLVSFAIAIDMNGVIKLEKHGIQLKPGREEVIMYGSFEAGDGRNLEKSTMASKRRVMPCH